MLVWPSIDEPTWRDGRILGVSPAKDTSGFEVDLGDVSTLDRLDIQGLPERFLKRVRLEGSGDRVHWTLLVAERTLFNLSSDEGGPRSAPLKQTTLAFAPGAYRYLRVIWDDHAGARFPTPTRARARTATRNGPVADTLFERLAFELRGGQHDITSDCQRRGFPSSGSNSTLAAAISFARRS